MQETKLIASKISSKYFEWLKVSKCFAADISSLPRSARPKGQIWNDSCDVGFVMVSEKTNRELIFFFKETDMTADGEIAGWQFVASHAFNKGVIDSDITCLIVND